MPPTKTFPKYWVVDIGENAEHKLLPKFEEWFCETSKTNSWHFLSKFYGYTGADCNNGYEGLSFLYATDSPNIITLEEWHDHFFPNEKVAKPKATYTQYFKRSDGVVFTEESINDESIESIKESRKTNLASANRKQLLLNEHKKLFGNK